VDSLSNWIVWIHIVGGFTFPLAHGVSAGVAFRLREERDVPRVQALLDLSKLATQGLYARASLNVPSEAGRVARPA
jgi:hypothetical protein